MKVLFILEGVVQTHESGDCPRPMPLAKHRERKPPTRDQSCKGKKAGLDVQHADTRRQFQTLAPDWRLNLLRTASTVCARSSKLVTGVITFHRHWLVEPGDRSRQHWEEAEGV